MYNVFINHCANHNVVPTDVINELVELHSKGILTSDELTNIIRTISAACIEQKINKQLNTIVEKSLSLAHLSVLSVYA